MTIKLFTEEAAEGFRASVGLTLMIGIVTLLIALIATPLYDGLMDLPAEVDKSALYWSVYRFIFYSLSGMLWLLYICTFTWDFLSRSKTVKEEIQEMEDKDLQDFIEFCKKR